jgi:hypothetical protein
MGTFALITGSAMDRQELAELEDPATWNDETVEVLPAADDPRAVVSVRFTPSEFARVARHARASGQTLTDCIRDAVLNHVSEQEIPEIVAKRRVRA